MNMLFRCNTLRFFLCLCRNTRPVFLELSAWPTLNFDGDPGSCPFGTKKQGKLENKFISREIKENKEGIESINKEEVRLYFT